LLLNEKFTKPIGFNTWNTYLQKELPKCETVCYFIFNYLSENKLKVFRWKLLHFIIPTKRLLLKWKIMKNSLCNLCSIVTTIGLVFFQRFLGQKKRIVKKSGIENDITLYHLVFGYSCNNVAPVTNLCLSRATTRSHSSQWSNKKVAVET
jgi:hypothetical protein